MAQVKLTRQEATGNLPKVCLCCGQPSAVTVVRPFAYHPSWLGNFLIFGGLPYLVLTLFMTKRVVLLAPLCNRHRRHWLGRSVAVVVGFAAFMAITLAGFIWIDQMGEFPTRKWWNLGMFVVSLFLFVCWIVMLLACQSSAVRSLYISDTEVILTNVAEEFVEQLISWDRCVGIRATPLDSTPSPTPG